MSETTEYEWGPPPPAEPGTMEHFVEALRSRPGEWAKLPGEWEFEWHTTLIPDFKRDWPGTEWAWRQTNMSAPGGLRVGSLWGRALPF